VPIRYGFRRFADGDGFDDVDIDEMLRLLGDDLMETGDLEEAMDRLLREGFNDADGERVEGLRDLLDRTRAKRRELEQQADPDGEMQRYREWLDDIEGDARPRRTTTNATRPHERQIGRTTRELSEL